MKVNLTFQERGLAPPQKSFCPPPKKARRGGQEIQTCFSYFPFLGSDPTSDVGKKALPQRFFWALFIQAVLIFSCQARGPLANTWEKAQNMIQLAILIIPEKLWLGLVHNQGRERLTDETKSLETEGRGKRKIYVVPLLISENVEDFCRKRKRVAYSCFCLKNYRKTIHQESFLLSEKHEIWEIDCCLDYLSIKTLPVLV